MNEQERKKSKWRTLRKLLLLLGLPLLFFFLLYSLYFTYNLPQTATELIKEELDKYGFGPYELEVISVRHDKAVLGPIVFGEGEDSLKVAKVHLDYSFEGIQKGDIESITVSGVNLHLNRQGKWNIAGLDKVLKGISNFREQNPSDGNSKLPSINVETSILTLHYLGHQYTFPLSVKVKEKKGQLIFDVETNLARNRIQTFTFYLDQDTQALKLNLDSFELDISQAGHFLQRFGMTPIRITLKRLSSVLEFTTLGRGQIKARRSGRIDSNIVKLVFGPAQR